MNEDKLLEALKKYIEDFRCGKQFLSPESILKIIKDNIND